MNGIVRKTSIFVAILFVVAAGGWFGRKAYKKATEHRLVSEAATYLQKKDLRNASLCLERALQVNPLSPGAAKGMADMLELAGIPAAVNWRNRAVLLAPNDSPLRLAWAETALLFHDLPMANKALDGLDGKTKSGPAYYKLAGALAWETGHPNEAEKSYLEALRLEPGNQTTAFNLDTIHLASTNDAIASAARASLERMSTNADFKLRALHYLKADAAIHKDLARALVYSWKIVRDPKVTLPDRMDHLQLLRAIKSPDFDPWRASLEAEAKTSPATAFAFGQWMTTVQGPADALSWLNRLPPAIQTNPPVPLIIADCHVFLKDWRGLQALIQNQDWGDGNYFRLALESLAERSQDQPLASQAAWDKAARQADHRIDRLTRLARLSAEIGWAPEHTALLRTIVSEFPEARWAKDSLMSDLYSTGNSRELAQFLSQSYESDPANAGIKNNLAAISLLRKSDLPTAYRLAREAYDTAPENPFFISTYAYSLLLQKKNTDAAKIISGIKTLYLKIPSIAAYYGVVEAETGHKEAARDALQRAEAGHLLPEEKEMVRLAKAGL